MPPSSQSGALKELFLIFAKNFPQDGNTFLERAVYDQVQQAGAEAPGVALEDVVIPAGDLSIPCISFKPQGSEHSKHVLLYMHGGGYSFGSAKGHRKLTAHLALALGCPALSVDYRLTPEYPYPAANDDCLAAYKYLLDTGYPASKIIIAGDSCGGCLTAQLAFACLISSLPVPAASISLSPAYDCSTQDGGTMDTNEELDVLNTKPFVKMLSDRYAQGRDKKDPLISPIYAKDDDLARLPPHWISVSGHDMLRDHGERMADRLRENGVEIVLRVHEGQQHVFEFMAGRAPEADQSIRDIAMWAREKVGA